MAQKDTRKPQTVIAELRRWLGDCQKSNQRLTEQVNEARGRATRAEQEAAEWKRRFDTLLTKTRINIAPEDVAAAAAEPRA